MFLTLKFRRSKHAAIRFWWVPNGAVCTEAVDFELYDSAKQNA